ncbi:MAG: nucleoside triphosphate diphosphatase [Pseudomonadota bacterium]|nr:nucleoside triphosphate diphosphatase [Pseudomonadota bacterium]
MSIERLRKIMVALRDPERGCPWDREQTWASIAPHTLEEAFELADAIEQGEAAKVRDELGDLLFQVVFQARIAEEQGLFGFDEVAAAISDKLERRHPHVFGAATVRTAAEQTAAWEVHKAAEREAAGLGRGVLDGVALGLPALTRAAKLGRRAAGVGFDWVAAADVVAKLDEELDELRRALAAHDDAQASEELGDLLFTIAQLGRHLGADAEASLRAANAKFERRFRHIEAALAARGRTPQQASMADLETLWAQAKQEIG